jgi:hypothetical protein
MANQIVITVGIKLRRQCQSVTNLSRRSKCH